MLVDCLLTDGGEWSCVLKIQDWRRMSSVNHEHALARCWTKHRHSSLQETFLYTLLWVQIMNTLSLAAEPNTDTAHFKRRFSKRCYEFKSWTRSRSLLNQTQTQLTSRDVSLHAAMSPNHEHALARCWTKHRHSSLQETFLYTLLWVQIMNTLSLAAEPNTDTAHFKRRFSTRCYEFKSWTRSRSLLNQTQTQLTSRDVSLHAAMSSNHEHALGHCWTKHRHSSLQETFLYTLLWVQIMNTLSLAAEPNTDTAHFKRRFSTRCYEFKSWTHSRSLLNQTQTQLTSRDVSLHAAMSSNHEHALARCWTKHRHSSLQETFLYTLLWVQIMNTLSLAAEPNTDTAHFKRRFSTRCYEFKSWTRSRSLLNQTQTQLTSRDVSLHAAMSPNHEHARCWTKHRHSSLQETFLYTLLWVQIMNTLAAEPNTDTSHFKRRFSTRCYEFKSWTRSRSLLNQTQTQLTSRDVSLHAAMSSNHEHALGHCWTKHRHSSLQETFLYTLLWVQIMNTLSLAAEPNTDTAHFKRRFSTRCYESKSWTRSRSLLNQTQTPLTSRDVSLHAAMSSNHEHALARCWTKHRHSSLQETFLYTLLWVQIMNTLSIAAEPNTDTAHFKRRFSTRCYEFKSWTRSRSLLNQTQTQLTSRDVSLHAAMSSNHEHALARCWTKHRHSSLQETFLYTLLWVQIMNTLSLAAEPNTDTAHFKRRFSTRCYEFKSWTRSRSLLNQTQTQLTSRDVSLHAAMSSNHEHALARCWTKHRHISLQETFLYTLLWVQIMNTLSLAAEPNTDTAHFKRRFSTRCYEFKSWTRSRSLLNQTQTQLTSRDVSLNAAMSPNHEHARCWTKHRHISLQETFL